jgi:nucleoside-diphosphate-sugar epimerase
VKKLVITGATGFLGFRTVEMLRPKGYEITALGRNLSKGQRIAALGARFEAIDLADEKKLTAVFSGADAVIHCAALASPWGDYRDFYRANVEGTRNVLAAIEKAGVPRLVHISTPSIYIEGCNRENILESDPIPTHFSSAYGETKWAAELLVDAAVKKGLIAITLRPQGLFGPEDPHILPRLLRIAKRGKLPIIGSGKTKIDFTYVDNVVDAVELSLLANPALSGRKYNITNGDPRLLYTVFEKLLLDLGHPVKRISIPYSLVKVVALVNQAIHRTILRGKEPSLTSYSIGVLAFSRTLSIAAAKKDLGYDPKISIDAGMKILVDWYRKQPIK